MELEPCGGGEYPRGLPVLATKVKSSPACAVPLRFRVMLKA